MKPEEISKYVGKKIRYYRKKKGFTQDELGKSLGVKGNTISSYEKGTNETGNNALFKIASVLEISVNDLFPPIEQDNIEIDYFDTHVSAGTPEMSEPVTKYNTRKISIPNHIAGKLSKDKSIKCVKLNGESMNNVIPNGSLIGFKPTPIENLKNGDIVVFNDDYEYSVKRFYNNKDEGKFIFKPDSTDKISFSDYVVKYENADKLRIEGKVVMYLVELD